jgi:CheY-like chemotaxis protein
VKLNANILILEDEPLIRLLLVSQMEQAGAFVVEAEFCADALRLIRNTSFDLAVLDYRLPDGCSLDLIRTIRAEARTLSVILLSGEADRIPAEAFAGLNILAVFSKPPEMERLMVIVRQIVGQGGRLRGSAQVGRYTLLKPDAASFALPAGADGTEWLALDCSTMNGAPPPGLLEFLATAGSRVAVVGAGPDLRRQIGRLNHEVECVADADALAALSRRRCMPGERAALLNAAIQSEEK